MGSLRRFLVWLLVVLTCGASLFTAASRLMPEPSRATSDAPIVSDPEELDVARVGTAERPDVVLVLMDDFSLDLLQTMRHARAMAAAGASYPNAFVVDSMCCVSRASILTGQYPHQTGVRTNTANLPNAVGPVGGWEAFRTHGNPGRSFNVRLQRSGYETGFVGKYLNEYSLADGAPAGWSEWRAVSGEAYDGWGFDIVGRDGSVDRVDTPSATASPVARDRGYATNVIGGVAVDFVERHRGDAQPYFLMVSPFAPHSRVGGDGAYPGDPLFPPAIADRPSARRPAGNCGAVSCSSLGLDDLPGFRDARGDNRPSYDDGRIAPAWRTNAVRLSASEAVRDLRDRARMAQAVDRWLGRLIDTAGPDAYVFLTSDNGFHLGQHGLERGKGTPYDSDVHVPLLVTGPGVAPGPRDDLVTNVDLAPTIESLAGLATPDYRFGTSFDDSLGEPTDADRTHVFFEHTWARSLGTDPDKLYGGGTMDLIPSYVAVRSRDGLLVRFDLDPGWSGARFAWEFYDYRDDGYERTNTYARAAKRPEVAALRRALGAFLACSRARRDAAVTAGCRDL
jgi:N-acetylglucosamine-6-sulfatase